MRKSGSNVQMMGLRPLAESINSGEMGLPDFQRDFDWSAADVRALLATTLSGWPAGSLLLLDARKTIFKLREFEGGPNLSKNPEYAVLDGQQRLTSLYQALFAKGDTLFAVSWNDELGEDLDERIVYYKRSVWNAKYATIHQQLEHEIIPVYVLKSPSDYFEWRDRILDVSSEKERVRSALNKIYKEDISRIHDYEFPAVILDASTEPEAIARIFERVNRTGMRLNAFDLMVAKTYSENWNLRIQWEEACASNPEVSAFLEEDGMALLQAMALRERKDVRQSAVLSLPKNTVQEHWIPIVAATGIAVQFLVKCCGVVQRDFLPYGNIIAPLVALAADGAVQERQVEIRRWFFHTAFMSSFDAAANTRLAAHYANLRADRLGKISVATTIVEIDTVTKKSNRSFYNGFLSALCTSFTSDDNTLVDEFLYDELSPALLFNINEITDQLDDFPISASYNDLYRGVLNSIVVPRRYSSVFDRLSAQEALALATDHGFREMVDIQLNFTGCSNLLSVKEFFKARSEFLEQYIKRNVIDSDSIYLSSAFIPDAEPDVA